MTMISSIQIESIKGQDDEEMEDITVSVSVEHEYSVKIVNPCRMSDFKTVKIMEIPSESFTSLDDMRGFFSKNLPHGNVTAINEVELGYFEPGHGAKGKKVWLCQDSDLKPMYKCHATKRMISCWCYSEKLEF